MLESASDYAVKIDGLPYGEYTEQELFEYLKCMWLRKMQESSELDCDIGPRI